MDAFNIPAERLSVFISSSQNNEGVFAWGDVRRRIKNHLKKCIYLNPFIIEDEASVIQSSQFYQRQLLRADIVVLLVKGEIRKGTATEYALASTHKKPLLVYFLEDGSLSELSVINLKNELQTKDYCTYRAMKSFESIETEILNDVIKNVIRFFQDMPLYVSDLEQPTEQVLVGSEVDVSKFSTPTKTAIALFESCYGYIFDLLGISYVKSEEKDKESTLHHMGIKSLEWLITGKTLNDDGDILKLIESVTDLYNTTDWLMKRWDAIRFALLGDSEKALEVAKHALSLAKSSGVPKWIINNILIDCRNLEIEVYNLKGKWVKESEMQKQLEESQTIIYLPVLDRYLGDIYSALIKEEIKFQNASHNTRFHGTNIGAIINNVENYFFSALLYGSYTHMIMSREILSKVLYKCADFFEKAQLLFNSIKLLVVGGQTEEFKKLLDHNWDDVYFETTTSADEIWKLAENAPYVRRDSIKQAVITKLGLYFTNTIFNEAEEYLEAFALNVYWRIAENYLECLEQNISRLKPEKIVVIIIGIIKDQRFHLGRELSNIILHIKLNDIDINMQKDLYEALAEKLPVIVKNGGTPQIIAALASQTPDVFTPLASIPDNGLEGIEKILYDINMGKGDWSKVLVDEIQTARCQFEANRTPGQYIDFFELPYAMIKKIVRKHYKSSMNSIIAQQFFPLCIEVLNSQVAAQIINDCIDCLCDVLVFAIVNKNDIPAELLSAILSIDEDKIVVLWDESIESFTCRVLMLKIMIGAVEKEELLKWCFEYSKKDTNEKIALAKCIEQFILQDTLLDQIDTTILSIVMQCFEDEYHVVRQIACDCLVLLLKTKYQGLAEQKLYRAAIDPSHYVRNYVLNLCKTEKIVDTAINNKLVEIIKNDANYAIRCRLI